MTVPFFPYIADFEVRPGTFSLRRKMCSWIEEQSWNKEVMGWKYNIGDGKVVLSVHTTEEKYLDVFYMKWGEHLKKLTQEENE